MCDAVGYPANRRRFAQMHSVVVLLNEEVKEMAEDLPVTGAWAPGDPVGRRQFFTFADDRPFALDSGSVLQSVTLAYETWGELNSDASNASSSAMRGPVIHMPLAEPNLDTLPRAGGTP